MATRPKFEINGALDTGQNCLTNLNLIADCCGCFVTWDPVEGQWSVIINDEGPSVYSFTESNIIGAINVTGSGVNDIYNQVSIEFPHKDLRDTNDYVDLTLPLVDRYSEELDNRLKLDIKLINDPTQAQYIATRELKQSRIDKIATFRTDYTSNGLKAGDIIDITLDAYIWDKKKFRIITIEEDDTDQNQLVYAITAQEYDPDVYDMNGLVREFRSKKTGIVPKSSNSAIRAQNSFAATKLALTQKARAHGLELAFNKTSNTWVIGYKETSQIIQHDTAIIEFATTQVAPPDLVEGRNFVLRGRVINPDIGQVIPVGRRAFPDDKRRFPEQGTAAIATGDGPAVANPEGFGNYTLLVDLKALADIDPNNSANRYIIIWLGGYWLYEYNRNPPETRIFNPVRLSYEIWKGGTVTGNGVNYTYSTPNPGSYYNSDIAGQTFTRAALAAEIDVGMNNAGEFVGYFIYDTWEMTHKIAATLPLDYVLPEGEIPVTIPYEYITSNMFSTTVMTVTPVP
jgi:hypothetical protein